jgi:serine/threonine protein kinase
LLAEVSGLHVKISDFGLSKLRHGESSGGKKGATKGSTSQTGKEAGKKIERVGKHPGTADGSGDGSGGAVNMSMTAQVGTPAWMAPELITSTKKTRASHKVDIFSFGVLVWECFSRETPYLREIEEKRLKVIHSPSLTIISLHTGNAK